MTHYSTLLNFVKRRVRSTEAAHDIVQDTWLRVAESRCAAPIANPLAFFYRIAGNLTIDRQRETEVRERYIDSGDLPEHVEDGQPGNDARLIAQEKLDLVTQAIEELPLRCKEVFLLRKVEQLEVAEITERLGISRNMVEKHLRRALLHCQTRLAEYEQ